MQILLASVSLIFNAFGRLLSKLVPHISGGAGYVKLADVGGGTGNFTAALGKALSLDSERGESILCVDPFEEMLKNAYDHAPLVEPVLMGAVEFARTEQTLSCILLKEVIHHIPSNEWDTLFNGFFKQLVVGGVIIIITRPQEVEYPLFPRAAEIWKEHQEPAEPYCEALRKAGFDVRIEINSYLINLQKNIWINMVSNKFWSTFSHCTDEELNEGLEFLEAKHEGDNVLTFNDNLVFIVASKLAEKN